MSQRALIFEDCKAVTLLAAGGTLTLQTPPLRPRLEGWEGFLVGPAARAVKVDNAVVTLHVRPTGGMAELDFLQANLTIANAQVDGTELSTTGTTVFPWGDQEVSGALRLGLGSLQFRLQPWGVVHTVQMLLTNRRPVGNITALVIWQMHGDVDPRQWELERIAQAQP